jgi:hypothetical protein
MPKHIATSGGCDGSLATQTEVHASASAEGRRPTPGLRSSIDPLASTDRYRLVVPFSADPRRLGARRTGAERTERSAL